MTQPSAKAKKNSPKKSNKKQPESRAKSGARRLVGVSLWGLLFKLILVGLVLCVALIVYLARRFYWKPLLLTGLLVIIVVLTFSGSIVLFQVTEGGRAISTLQSFSQPLNLQKNYFGPSSWAIYLHTILHSFPTRRSSDLGKSVV